MKPTPRKSKKDKGNPDNDYLEIKAKAFDVLVEKIASSLDIDMSSFLIDEQIDFISKLSVDGCDALFKTKLSMVNEYIATLKGNVTEMLEIMTLAQGKARDICAAMKKDGALVQTWASTIESGKDEISDIVYTTMGMIDRQKRMGKEVHRYNSDGSYAYAYSDKEELE